MLVTWLIFIHVLAAISFFLSHGASAAMVFKLRSETDFARIRGMLDLSISTMPIYTLSFLVMGLTGLIMPFVIHIWDKLWVWLSIGLMLFVAIYMYLFNETSYKKLRRLVGLPYRVKNSSFPAEPPASAEEVAAMLKQNNPYVIALVGYGIPAVVLWLMVFKPF